MSARNLLTSPAFRISALAAILALAIGSSASWGQRVKQIRMAPPSKKTQAKIDAFIDEILTPDIALKLDPRQSKLLRTKRPVERMSATDPNIVDFNQFSPTEFELIGNEQGQTTLTLWFATPGGKTEVLRYLVTVERGEELEYGELEKKINEMFPNSIVQLIAIADKLIVRGYARSAEEAVAIMSVIRGQSTNQSGQLLGPASFITQGVAADVQSEADDVPASNVINMLKVSGEQQVMLKVRVAELTRTALRRMGTDIQVNSGDFVGQSLFGLGSNPFTAILNSQDVFLALQALSTNGYSKILAEPNLVTLSGQPASFIAGGEFAVPVVVGIDGAAAATTNFRGFGTQLSFVPTVLDKDRIRLFVAPSFSTINSDNTVNGIPGLNSRAVSTTVDLREGQWLAIAGLIQDQQAGSKSRIPLIGDLPLIGAIFSNRQVRREETELVVLVSPELVHPLEAERVPLLLPGMEIKEPNGFEFFIKGRSEGNPNCDFRSTMHPSQRNRIWDAKRQAHRDAKAVSRYQRSEGYYIQGPHGFSK